MSNQRLRPIGNTQRRRILKRDNHTCQYCFELATECDHITPYSYIPDNTDANLVASCRLCNSIAGSMVFDSFILKYQYIKREREKRAPSDNPEWYEKAVRAVMDAQEEAPEPVKVVKPKKVKYIRPPKTEVVKPPRERVKPISTVAKIVKPKRRYYPPRQPSPPPSLDMHEFVAGMYEYYAKRNTPAYVCEIFERWLMLKTTKEWAAKNGRTLPASIGFTNGL